MQAILGKPERTCLAQRTKNTIGIATKPPMNWKDCLTRTERLSMLDGRQVFITLMNQYPESHGNVSRHLENTKDYDNASMGPFYMAIGV